MIQQKIQKCFEDLYYFNNVEHFRSHLKLGDWTFCYPFRDGLEAQNIFDHLLQVWVLSDKIVSHHHVQVIQDSSEVEISPC